MKKSTEIQLTALFLMLVLLNGCSTIFGRQADEQTVMFDSNVPNVEVSCSGKRTMTPGSLPLRQNKNHACTARLEGFQKESFQLKSGISGSGFAHSTAINTATWGWWTLGIGTGIGWLVDGASGAMKNLKEDSIYLEMKPLEAVKTPVSTESLNIESVNTASATQSTDNKLPAVIPTPLTKGR